MLCEKGRILKILYGLDTIFWLHIIKIEINFKLMAKNNFGKKITIDGLAKMIKEGFDKTATVEQLNGVEGRLGGVEDKISNIEKNVAILKKDVKEIKYKLTDVDNRTNKLEIRTDYIENILDVPVKKS